MTTTNEDFQASEGYLDMDLLRFTTAGSVDDGKSTPHPAAFFTIPKTPSRTRWLPLKRPVRGEVMRK